MSQIKSLAYMAPNGILPNGRILPILMNYHLFCQLFQRTKENLDHFFLNLATKTY
jgi:hypothetical protein